MSRAYLVPHVCLCGLAVRDNNGFALSAHQRGWAHRHRMAGLTDGAGFRDARPTATGGGWVSVYASEAQGIDAADGGPWLVVCEAHATTVNVETLAAARSVMLSGGDEFCDCCRGEHTLACAPGCAPAEGNYSCHGCNARFHARAYARRCPRCEGVAAAVPQEVAR